MPDRVFERSTAVMIIRTRTTLDLVLNKAHAAVLSRRQLRNERALPSEIGDQASRDVTELRWIVLVNEEDVHHWLTSVRLRAAVMATHY